MTPILSATIISFNLIIFLSFLSTRIDSTINWNWFLVFIPVFFLQTCFLIDNLVLIVKNRKANKKKIQKLFMYLLCILLMVTFEILLCLKLQYYRDLKLTYVFIPFWVFCLILFFYFIFKLKND